MKPLFAIALSLFVLSALSGPARAADHSPKDCGLAERSFCGVWLPVGKSGEAGGRVTISATGWTWENGDKADCQLLDQGDQGDRRYATFHCTIRWHPHGEEEQQFFQLYSERLHKKDALGFIKTHIGRIYISSTEKLECLQDGWNELIKDEKRYYIIENPKSKCGYIDTEFHDR